MNLQIFTALWCYLGWHALIAFFVPRLVEEIRRFLSHKSPSAPLFPESLRVHHRQRLVVLEITNMRSGSLLDRDEGPVCPTRRRGSRVATDVWGLGCKRAKEGQKMWASSSIRSSSVKLLGVADERKEFRSFGPVDGWMAWRNGKRDEHDSNIDVPPLSFAQRLRSMLSHSLDLRSARFLVRIL
jgi:hypothetical protein